MNRTALIIGTLGRLALGRLHGRRRLLQRWRGLQRWRRELTTMAPTTACPTMTASTMAITGPILSGPLWLRLHPGWRL